MMLRLWSQATRPQLSCTCVTCSGPATGVLARRTASAIPRRRLKLVDAFTILLTPVLATAFVADASRKDRRRIEWDRKIAEVEEEVERLQHKGSQVLRCLRGRVSSSRKAIHHTRSYSTDLRSRALEDDTKADADVPHSRTMELGDDEDDGDDDAHQALTRDAQDLFTIDPQSAENTADAVRRIERLVAIKLAIKLLLHINIGTSPRFIDTNPSYSFEASHDAEYIGGMVGRLKTIRRSLRELNSADRWPVSILQKMPREEQVVIDQEIRRHARDFKLGKLSVTRLVKRIGNSIIGSPEPPSVKSYIPLMITLSRARLDDLAYLVISAMDESRLALHNQSVVNVVRQYGKNRDAHRFELFLDSVTKADAAAKYTELWEWRVINEIEVPCPTSNDSRLLQILVYTALRCNQPHRAEAWSSQLKYSDGPKTYTSHILRNFMKFYATERNWQRGQAWLLDALDWSVSVGPDVIRDLQRVVFAMLELCVACGKQDAYTCILQAAVYARVGVFESDADLLVTKRSESILAEWESLHNSLPTGLRSDLSSAQTRAKAFCDEVTPKITTLGLSRVSSRFEWPTPASTDFAFHGESSEFPISTNDSAAKWHELCQQQRAEVEKLKAELTKLDWLRSRIATSEAEELDSQAEVGPPTSPERLSCAIRSSSVPNASVTFAPNSFPEDSIPPVLQEKILQPPSNIASRPLEANQQASTASLELGQGNPDLKQKSAAIFSQVANSRLRRDKNSGLEDLIRLSTANNDRRKVSENLESASAQGRRRQEILVEDTYEESSYPRNQLPPDSIQTNNLSDFTPFNISTSTEGQDIDPFTERDADSPLAAASDSLIDRTSELQTQTADAVLLRPVRKIVYEHPRPSAPYPTSPADVPKGTAEHQTIEVSKSAGNGQRINSVEMPPENESLATTLKGIHLGKPELPKLGEPPQKRLVEDKDRKRSPHKVIHLTHFRESRQPRLFRWLNGELKVYEWNSENAKTLFVPHR